MVTTEDLYERLSHKELFEGDAKVARVAFLRGDSAVSQLARSLLERYEWQEEFKVKKTGGKKTPLPRRKKG